MATRTDGFSRLDVRRREQTPQALARLVVVALFVSLWFLLWLARLPMPFPFLCVLLAEMAFFLIYWRTVFLLRSVRAVEIAHYVMLAAEIVFHTTIVYFLGGISWLGSFAYVFGLIFTNTFLDLRRGLIYTGGASLAFGALILLDATGTIPHYVYLEQGDLRYSDPEFVTTTLVGAGGVFFSIYLWVNWVGRQLRVERDAAVRAQDGLLDARTQLQRANEALEERVLARTSELERANTALKESEERFRRISDNAPDVIYRYRLQPTFTCEYMSPASLTITGYSPAEYYVDPMLGLTTVHPDDRDLLQDAFLGGTDEPVTVRCVRKDGAIIWSEQRFVAIYDRQGNVIAIEGIARDITARRHAEDSLRDSEQRLNLVVETSPDLIAIQERNGRYTFVNSAYRAVLGYQPEDLIGLNPAEFIHADDLEDVTQRFSDMVQFGLPGEATFRFRHHDGHWVTLEANGQVLADDAGQPTGVVVVSRDVTERKQAEDALRDSKEVLRATIESTHDGILVVDENGQVAHANARFLEMWRIPTELFQTRDDDRLLAFVLDQLVEPEAFVAKVRELYESCDESFDTLRFLDARVFERFSRPLVTNGAVTGRVWSFRDVTERRRAEQVLRETEERFRKIFEDGPLGMAIVTPELRTLRANSTLCNMLGYSEEQLSLITFGDITHADDVDRDVGLAAQLFAGEISSYKVEKRYIRKDGSVLWATLTASVIRREDGTPLYGLGMVEDITERRRQEEALRESESKFRTMAETVAAAAFIFQGDRMRYVNSAAEAITGYPRDELLGMNFWDVIHPDDRDMVRWHDLGREHAKQKPARYEVRILTKARAERWVDFTAGMIEFDGAPAVLGTAFDITERKRAEDALREQARRDPLTGLLNHAAIVDELRTMIARDDPASTHAVAMVDVDGLKAVNDTFGHQIGDLVLLTVARALTREGAVVGRYGGDEFVALLKGRDRAGAERYRNAVIEAVTGARLKDPETGSTVPVVVSMGLAIYPDEAESIEELIKLSDSAMYAWRRHRPIVPGEARPSGPLPGARAAEMIGELVPLLTSPGDLSDKFRAVAHRLSVGAGYDAVNFALFADRPGPPLAANTFARVADELVEAWNDDQRAEMDEPHPIRLFFEQNPLPVIMDDPWNDQRLLESQRTLLRTAGFRSVLVAPMLWHGEVVGSLGVANQQEHAFTSRDAQFLAAVATQVTAIVRMATLVDELQSSAARLSDAQTETVMLLASVAEARDRTTGRHLQNVRALTEALARELNYDEDAVRELGLAAVLHDIGKIRVPDAVLGNTDQLRPDEWELIRRHTSWGAELLSGRPGFELAAVIAHSHHERWDGTGYPAGLAGDALPRPAAIVAVADAFDVIIDSRPYSKGRSVAHAVREIAACAGKQFSPQVVDALLRLHAEHRLPSTAHARRAA